MTTCAVVQIADGLVINTIMASPSDIAPDNCILVDIFGLFVEIGYVWDGTSFIKPIINESA